MIKPYVTHRHMLLGPMQFVTVDGMPAVKQTVEYSCGAKSIRTYQGGDLIDVDWLVPIKPMRINPADVIEHREVELLNHYYRNK